MSATKRCLPAPVHNLLGEKILHVSHQVCKRQRVAQFPPAAIIAPPATARHSKRVRFATKMAECISIPAIESQEEKERLFYSTRDFARFAFGEKVRRDTFLLTLSLSSMQQQRLTAGLPLIPAITIQRMYDKVLAPIGRLANTRNQSNHPDTFKPNFHFEPKQEGATRLISARAA